MKHLPERMVFATPSSSKPEQAWQSTTCLQCCTKVQRIVPKWQATSRTWSATRFDWNNFHIPWMTSSPDSWHRIHVSTSASSEPDRSCLRFLWLPSANELVQIYEYQHLVITAKISPTCANYDLKRVGLDNEEWYPIAAKAILNNFHMDYFIKSVETSEEAIEVFSQLQLLLSKHGFELRNWISKNDAVTKAISEYLKSYSNIKQNEVEPMQKNLQC